MKTVSAEIISSKPISLSTAAKFLSNFVEYDNRASRAINTYLRHSSDAFNELSEFHKKLKSSGSNRKSSHSYASSGISAVQIGPSTLSAQSSEGEEVAEKRKNSKREADEGELVESGVDGSESVLRNAHGEDLENDFKENLANGIDDSSEAVTKKKHTQEDRDSESAENGGKTREKGGESISKTSASKGLGEGVGDDLSEKLSEKKRTKKKKKKKKIKGEEDDDSVLPYGADEKEDSEGRYENNISIGLGEGVAGTLPGESSEKKDKRKRKGYEGRDNLLPNGVRTGEGEILEAKSGSEEGKEERKKKQKIEEAAMRTKLHSPTERRSKKAKKRTAD